MRRLAHLSDLHFGSDPSTQARLYEGLLETFRGQKVDALVLTGDVFDTPEPKLVDGFIQLHQALEAKIGRPTPTLILPGNHDRRVQGVFAPYQEGLFNALRARFESRPDVQVLGGQTPFLAQLVSLPDFPCDIVAYDSTYLPTGIASAGGVVRKEDLICVGAELARGNVDRPLLFLLHHHLIPTPVTDTSAIDTKDRPAIQKLLVSRLLPWLVSNGDREELTMTALGAGSALTTLQTLGRAVLVLHGHKHYATVRLLKGIDGDADLLITSAGSSGLTQDWAGGEFAEAPKLWPSVNFIELTQERVHVMTQAWSPVLPERRNPPRTLVSVSRVGQKWNIDADAAPRDDFQSVLALNALDVQLAESKARLGRLDVLAKRQLVSHPRAWLDEYWEVLEGAPSAMVRELTLDGTAQADAPCPARIRLGKDGNGSWHIEGGLFRYVKDAHALQPGRAYDSILLLNRSRAEVARLSVQMGPVKTAPFASVTDLTTGKERPYRYSRDGDVVTVVYENCPSRMLLKLSWPLER